MNKKSFCIRSFYMRTRLTFFLLCICGTLKLFGQSNFCMGHTLMYEVNSENGVNVRAEKSTSSEKVGAIPHCTEIEVCSSFQGDVEVEVQGKSGYWMKMKFGDLVGYIHAANLEQISCNPSKGLRVSFTDDKGYDQISIGFPVSCNGDYGIYVENDNSFSSTGIEYSEIRTNYTMLFYGKLPDQDLPYMISHGRRVSPKGRFSKKEEVFRIGEEFQYVDEITGSQYLFQCSGKIEEDLASKMIKDYSLELLKDGKKLDLIKMDLFAKDESTYEGGVWLKWIGDLDGDGQLEIILKVQSTYKGWNYFHFEWENDKLVSTKVGWGSSC